MFGRSQGKKPYQEIIPNFYYFAEGAMLDCNIYAILNKKKKITLIDLGNGLSFSALQKAFDELGWKKEDVESIIITHDHLDHLMGIYKIINATSGETPIIYGHPYTIEMLNRGNEEEIVPPLFGVNANTFQIEVNPINNTKPLSESEMLSIGSFSFRILYTPGHSKGSICLYEPNKKILIAGDVVFPNGSFGRYDFPGCSLSDLKKSIAKLAELDVEYLCAGHMTPVQRNANHHLKLSLRNINMM